MAKITNTPIHNAWGDGHEQELTLDNGEKYIIRNSPIKNAWGDGHIKEVTKQKSSCDFDLIAQLIEGGVILIVILIGFLFFKLL